MTEYKSVVLAGGGVKGLAYLGVLKFLKEKEALHHISTFAGCSIGALTCLLMILDYPYNVLKTVMDNYDISKLNYPRMECIINDMCLDDGNSLEKFVKTFIKNAGHDENINMKSFYEITGKKLVVSITDINSKKNILADYKNFPEMPVFLAVKISMCIPFVYKPVLYKNNFYCDGYLSCNFPVKYFDTKDTLCIYFSSEASKEMNRSDILYNILKTPMFVNQQDSIKYAKDSGFKVIELYTPKTIHSLNFRIDKSQKEILYEFGYDSIKNEM